jgi:hypothetical protein
MAPMRSLPGALLSRAVLVTAFAASGCSKDAAPGADYRKVALEFARSLAARDYAKAHAMTTEACRGRMTVEQLRAAFEAIVPSDWGPIGPVEVGQTLASWPDKQPGDLGWAYVSIGGEAYSEAVVVVVAAENGAARIREVEFGRP